MPDQLRVEKYSEIILSGGVVLGPSDTCYGLFCDATNLDAVNKIFKIKERDTGKPLSMIVANKAMAKRYAKWDEQLSRLWRMYTPGAYTLVVPRNLDLSLPGQMGHYIGLRVPMHPTLLKISEKLDVPIVATSANNSGQPVHYELAGLDQELDMSLIDYIDDQGKITQNPPSTLIIWNEKKETIQVQKRD